jgi:polyisoprenoid-binding protein YceI
MKKIFLILALTLSANFVQAQNWVYDPSHTKIQFVVTHLLITEVPGFFRIFDIQVTSSKEDFTDAIINFTADVSSIDTENERRDNHLRSDDFFNAEKYPKLVFKGKSFKKISGNKYKLAGDLTIRDITKQVELDVIYAGTIKDPSGNTKAGFKITGNISRSSFGLKWNNLTEAGGAVVSDDVMLICNLQLKKN